VLILPTLTYGYYPAFVEWPESISISASNLIGMVGDIVRALHRCAISRFLLLDGGVSTHYPLRIAASDLHNDFDVKIAVTSIRGLSKEVEDRLSEQEGGGHADEMETSCMLAIRPDLVFMEKTVRDYREPVPGSRGKNGTLKVAVAGRMNTASGVNGDPTLATREKGETLLAAMARDVLRFLESFR
jgi:creatinine amidohydrolase